MSRPLIDPALGMNLVPERTLVDNSASVTVIVPAHNEQDTVAEVVTDAYHGLAALNAEGEVVVSASACTDNTAHVATDAGAQVVTAPAGKGAAISAGLQQASGDIICLIDGDLRYFGATPLVTLLVDPILRGIADACISDLYWRALYPQLWLHGFFAPVAGLLFPELPPKVGSTPWSGQRAAVRRLWPAALPTDFTVDLALLLHWNDEAVRMRPVLADDWVNPQRPKPDLMFQELRLLLDVAVRQKRIEPHLTTLLEQWYEDVHTLMATYKHGEHNPQVFEKHVLREAISLLPPLPPAPRGSAITPLAPSRTNQLRPSLSVSAGSTQRFSWPVERVVRGGYTDSSRRVTVRGELYPLGTLCGATHINASGIIAMKRSLPHRRRVGIGLVLVMVAAVALWASSPHHNLGPATGVAGALTSLGMLYLAWQNFRTGRVEAAQKRTLTEIADELAIAVRRQWEDEATVRRLHDPQPLEVCWRAADADLLEDWSYIASTARGWPGAAPSGWAADPAGLAGSGSDLAEVLTRVPTGRLVVLGEPGAGKTMLLIRLVLDLLAIRAPGDPVPVLVPLASWKPAEQDLHTWLVDRLGLDYPFLTELAPRAFGDINRARALLAHRLLLPVLDGLDEIPTAVRGRALDQINAALGSGHRLVVSCRVEDYRRALSPPTGVPVKLRAAAGVVLRELDPAAVKEYLRRDAGSPETAARWDPVLATLGTTTPAGQALQTPLLVSLASTIYNPRPGEHLGPLPDPAELCDPTRFPTRARVEEHLFDESIPAAYRPHPDPDRECRWTAQQAQNYLTFLARHLEHTLHHTTDLAWWELRNATPRLNARFWAGAVAALVLSWWISRGPGLAVGLTAGLTTAFASWLGVRLCFGLDDAASAPANGASLPVAKRRARLAMRFAIGLAIWLAIWLLIDPAAKVFSKALGAHVPLGGPTALIDLWWGVVNGVFIGLSVGLFLRFLGGPLEAHLPAKGLRWSPAATAGALASALAGGLVVGLAVGVAFGHRIGIGAGLAVVGVFLIYGVLSGAPADLTAATSPGAVLAQDRTTFQIGGLVVGLGGGLLACAADELAGQRVNPFTIVFFVVLGVAAAFYKAAWGPFTLTRCRLAIRRHLPWRLMEFLADAHQQRGVLRQVGAVYQFRHIQLQQHLTTGSNRVELRPCPTGQVKRFGHAER